MVKFNNEKQVSFDENIEIINMQFTNLENEEKTNSDTDIKQALLLAIMAIAAISFILCFIYDYKNHDKNNQLALENMILGNVSIIFLIANGFKFLKTDK